MQRLFAMFPDHGPGLGLLLLRLDLALALYAPAMEPPQAGAPPWCAWAARVAACLLVLGWMTPVSLLLAVVVLAVLLPAAAWWPPLLVTLAAALLGPGAYSLDARLFGRRVVDGPRDHPKE